MIINTQTRHSDSVRTDYCMPYYASKKLSGINHRHSLKRALEAAIYDDEFELVYQPQTDMTGQNMMGVEALLRWHSAELGTVSPDKFIPLAEKHKLIEDLGNLVIEKACQQASIWNKQHSKDIRIAINVSYQQVHSTKIVKLLESCMNKYRINANNLEIELTESTLIKDQKMVKNVLNQFKEIGIRTAMDDFGTGYSSLSYLASLPFDMVKIDRSFISMIGLKNSSTAIAEAIIQMCKKLNMDVLAEGVETTLQQNVLINNQCDFMQGNLISEPVSADEITTIAGMIPN